VDEAWVSRRHIVWAIRARGAQPAP
jgi:hypothetical protein